MTHINYWESIDSTNEELKRQIANGLKRESCIVADMQTMGRGRKGRSFYSPKTTGIYMSYVYFTNEDVEKLVAVTGIAAVITAKVLRKYTGKDIKIKWVNDLYLNDRKICGILTELVKAEEQNAVIVGIGINLCTELFPEDISDRAGAVVENNLNEPQIKTLKQDIINDIVAEFDMYRDNNSYEYIEDYITMSNVIGKRITVYLWNESFEATACGITKKGELIIQNDNGEEMILDSGEITIRFNQD